MHTCGPREPPRAMQVARLCRFELVPLGSHVAVLYSPPLAVHAHCIAGDDGRHRERHRREQEPARLRRVVQILGLGGSRRHCVWNFISMVLHWRSRVGSHYLLWRQRPSLYIGWSRSFLCLVGRLCRYQSEARQWHSTADIQRKWYTLGRSVRRTA